MIVRIAKISIVAYWTESDTATIIASESTPIAFGVRSETTSGILKLNSADSVIMKLVAIYLLAQNGSKNEQLIT